MHAYPIDIHTDVDPSVWASSPLVPPFNCAGDDVADLLNNEAEDAMIAALSIYVDQGKKVPVPDRAPDGAGVYLPALTMAKIALWNAMCDQGVTRSNLAQQLGISAAAAGRLVDLLHHSKLENVERALNVLGRRILLDVAVA
ncbi:hypothetical protein GCM10010082_31890 [Kushneria pakistanensis]|uniref:Antitoxin HicB n=1 Tax=Kushneria pakistanensis TaxID=1508770 RepID=A0ABQ3FS61_9GAMM|nr:type II toxin-antitoxin system HicB family antitoxin [Kushneria pakistanensis]GHC34759.1 hypothetical protein GCM10010082_31890 [Kushneria pakistanensis]